MPSISTIIYYINRCLNWRPSCVRNSSIDQLAKIGNGARIINCSVGRYSYIFDTKICNAKVGAFCSIAPGCVIGSGAHPIEWVSSSPVFTANKNVLRKNFSNHLFSEYEETTIGNDVWIGSNCLIKAGITIGNGAIIGMGSVLTHNVPEYEIWAGNPAKFIRKRFTDDVITRLNAMKWWEWPENRLAQYAEFFSSPEALIKEVADNIKD